MSDEPADPSLTTSVNQYRDLASYYDHLMLGGYYDYAAQTDDLAKLLQPGARILEVGVGTGLLAEALVDRGFEVTGVDHTEEMLELARERLGDRVPLYQADVITFDLGERFDAVISNGGVWYGVFDGETYGYCGHIPDRDAVARSLHRVLAHLEPDGQIILSIQDVHADKVMQLPDDVEYRQSIRDMGNDDIEKTYVMARGDEELTRQVLTLSYYSKPLFEDIYSDHGYAVAPFSAGDRYVVAKGGN
ncbi:MAG: class I SAM-dependent methyltransferase [Chromatiales bacterium]|nr:class I SAM-dependent methyltransferase [Chromatiales bacterium]